MPAGEPDGADPQPDEPRDRQPDRVEQAAHLPLASLRHHDAHGSPTPRRGHDPRRPRPGRAVLELHAGPDPRELPRGGLTLDLREVLLLHPEPGVRQAVREVAVVREQQQSLGVTVQTPHREHPGPSVGTYPRMSGRPCGSCIVVTTPGGLWRA